MPRLTKAGIALVVCVLAGAVVAVASAERDGREFCGRPPATSDAAPYTGPGPHPVAVLFDPITGGARFSDGWTLPPEWLTEEIQLVVCETATTHGPAETCFYDTVAVELMKTAYRYEVFEAATGVQVGEFGVAGEKGCPPALNVDGPTILQDVDSAAFRTELTPFVEDRVTSG